MENQVQACIPAILATNRKQNNNTRNHGKKIFYMRQNKRNQVERMGHHCTRERIEKEYDIRIYDLTIELTRERLFVEDQRANSNVKDFFPCSLMLAPAVSFCSTVVLFCSSFPQLLIIFCIFGYIMQFYLCLYSAI